LRDCDYLKKRSNIQREPLDWLFNEWWKMIVQAIPSSHHVLPAMNRLSLERFRGGRSLVELFRCSVPGFFAAVRRNSTSAMEFRIAQIVSLSLWLFSHPTLPTVGVWSSSMWVDLNCEHWASPMKQNPSL
jgi:hypothetical protein